MKRGSGLLAAAGALVAVASSAAATELMYQTGNNGEGLYATNTANGATTFVGNFGYSSVYADAFNGAGDLFALVNGFSDGTLASVNLSTGQATAIGSGSGVSDLMAMAFAPNGKLYVGSWATNDLYTMNTSTGAVTLIGNLDFGNVMGFAFAPNGQMYAIANNVGNGDESGLYDINLSTGAGTLVTYITQDSCLMGLAIDASNNFYATDYCSSDSPLYQINTSTGALTDLGLTGVSSPMGGDIFSTATHDEAPEPGTLALLGAALAGLGAFRRHRGERNGVVSVHNRGE